MDVDRAASGNRHHFLRENLAVGRDDEEISARAELVESFRDVDAFAGRPGCPLPGRLSPYHFRSGVRCPLVARVAFGLRDETYDVSANDEINASNVGSANVPVPIIITRMG